jgi:hypothetical protein
MGTEKIQAGAHTEIFIRLVLQGRIVTRIGIDIQFGFIGIQNRFLLIHEVQTIQVY